MLSEFFAANQCEERRTAEAVLHQEELSREAQTSLLHFLPKRESVSLLKKQKPMRKNTQGAVILPRASFLAQKREEGSWALAARRDSAALEMLSQPGMELPPGSLHLFRCKEMPSTISIPLPAAVSLCALISSLHLFYIYPRCLSRPVTRAGLSLTCTS